MANRRKPRVTQFTVQQIADGAMSIRRVAERLEGIAAAMQEGGIEKISIDGYSQLNRGLLDVQKFVGNAAKGLESARLEST